MEPVGTCGLCLEPRPLQQSHLIPQAVYRLTRQGGGQLAVITKTGSRIAGQEIRSPFLCELCETRLSREGETQTLQWGWRAGDGTFALRDALREATPLARDAAGVVAFDATRVPDLPVAAFIHFAAGVFWKAAAHPWRDGTRRLAPCDMGPYKEAFRRYLVGVEPFPAQARLAVHVISDAPPFNTFLLPHKNRWGEGWKHTFAIPGLIFIMFIGKSRPEVFDKLSPATFQLFLGPSSDNQLLMNALALPPKVPALGKLRDGLRARGLPLPRRGGHASR